MKIQTEKSEMKKLRCDLELENSPTQVFDTEDSDAIFSAYINILQEIME